jgi:hypothetical protein
MIVKRIRVLSLAKVAAAVYATLGLFIGSIFTLVWYLGGFARAAGFGLRLPAFISLLFGGAAIVVLPILYACLGFVVGLVGAGIYNLVASAIGGVELDTAP